MTKTTPLTCVGVTQTHSNRKRANFVNKDEAENKIIHSVAIAYNSTLMEHEIFQINEEYNFEIPVNPIDEVEPKKEETEE